MEGQDWDRLIVIDRKYTYRKDTHNIHGIYILKFDAEIRDMEIKEKNIIIIHGRVRQWDISREER